MATFNCCWLLLLMLWSHHGSTVESADTNILLIVIDDLAPLLGVYDTDQDMNTPNIDALAADSLVLTNAYTQQALCSPSRASFLSSRRPDTTLVFKSDNHLNDTAPDILTMPDYFMSKGYETYGAGKIFHSSSDFDPSIWTSPFFSPPNNHLWALDRNHSWYEVSEAERTADALPDDQILEYATDTLTSLAADVLAGSKKFFMAVGFRKPHLPFVCPKEFFDIYPLANISLAANQYAPQDMPAVAWYRNNEIRGYADIDALSYTGNFNTTIDDDEAKKLRRAYYSCVSYVDDLVGQLMANLTGLGLLNDTVVAFMGDHGYHLGESGEWAKFSNLQKAVRVPMMIRVPGMTNNGGVESDEMVELVDMFPTLVEAVGLPDMADCPEDPADSRVVGVCTEGTSLIPLANNSYSSWKQYAFSQWEASATVMGYTVISKR